MFPSYVLENLFVKGSLKNTESGFKFKLKNTIDSGTVTGMGPLTVDDKSYDIERITLNINSRPVRGNQITNMAPLIVNILSEIDFSVEGEPLEPGSHRLGFLFHVQEAGRMQFNITESLTE
jgi:hypothetical protein